MSRIPHLKVRYWKAAMVVMAGLLNCFLVIATDIAALEGIGPTMTLAGEDSLISKWMIKSLLNPAEEAYVLSMIGYDLNRLLPLLELFFVAYTLLELLVYVVLTFLATTIFTDGGEVRKWTYASHICWASAPQVANCSALRLLHFVWPKIAYSDAYLAFLHAKQVIVGGKLHGRHVRHYAHASLSIFNFLLSRIFALVIGFDAFIVKFRLASGYFDSGKVDFFTKLAAASFLWQVTSIVNLNWFVRDRFFILLFGGKRGRLDIDEMALMDVWKALLLRKVFESFGTWRGSIILLSMDDYDMQFLFLDDDEDAIHAEVKSAVASVCLGSSEGLQSFFSSSRSLRS